MAAISGKNSSVRQPATSNCSQDTFSTASSRSPCCRQPNAAANRHLRSTARKKKENPFVSVFQESVFLKKCSPPVDVQPEFRSSLTELYETPVKHRVDASESCSSNDAQKVVGFMLEDSNLSGDLMEDDGRLTTQSSASHYHRVTSSFISGNPNAEPKDSFETAWVCEGDYRSGSFKLDGSHVDLNEERVDRVSTSSNSSDRSNSSSFSSWRNKPHMGSDYRWEAIRAVRSQAGILVLNHFVLLKRLGSGDVGSVYLAELAGSRNYFAMKVMDKEDLESRNKLLRAQTEREILQCLDHPFLPTLYAHFETEKFSCLVMEFCPGGDIHALRQRQPRECFPEQAARFYVAEVLLALEYLHMLGIIYRDLKPENVLVREDGHIMLADFDLSLRCTVRPTLVKSANMAKSPNEKLACCGQASCTKPIQTSCIPHSCFSRLNCSTRRSNKPTKSKLKKYVHNEMSPLPELLAEPTGARSMSFVGTYEYLAPEIIKGEGHGSAVDWWTFGIFLYELLFGKTPFKGTGSKATLFNVVGQPLRFPESPAVSFAARDLIRALLVKEPQKRLAYRRGATELKQHPFFQSINWALIRSASPPLVPKPFVVGGGTVASSSDKAKGTHVKASFR